MPASLISLKTLIKLFLIEKVWSKIFSGRVEFIFNTDRKKKLFPILHVFRDYYVRPLKFHFENLKRQKKNNKTRNSPTYLNWNSFRSASTLFRALKMFEFFCFSFFEKQSFDWGLKGYTKDGFWLVHFWNFPGNCGK